MFYTFFIYNLITTPIKVAPLGKLDELILEANQFRTQIYYEEHVQSNKHSLRISIPTSGTTIAKVPMSILQHTILFDKVKIAQNLMEQPG